MQDILFDSYRKYQKECKPNSIKLFSSLPVVAIILLVLTSVCMVLSLLVVVFKWTDSIGVWCLVSEIILYIVMSMYTEHYVIKTSNTRLKTYVNYCSDILKWLQGIGFVTTKENIEKVISRVGMFIKQEEEKEASNKNRIDKWCQTLIFPTVLAVFSAIIREQTDATVIIAYATTLLITVGLLCLGACHCFNMASFFKKRILEEKKSFMDDLQGILDTQFEDRLINIYLENDVNEVPTTLLNTLDRQ